MEEEIIVFVTLANGKSAKMPHSQWKKYLEDNPKYKAKLDKERRSELLPKIKTYKKEIKFYENFLENRSKRDDEDSKKICEHFRQEIKRFTRIVEEAQKELDAL